MFTSRRGFLLSILGAGAALRQSEDGGNGEGELELLDTVNIAGYRYYEGDSVESELKRGTELVLVRDPHNEYDPRAIEILSTGGEKLGYVPRARNHVPAYLMDQGRKLLARVREVRRDSGPWDRVRIDLLIPKG